MNLVRIEAMSVAICDPDPKTAQGTQQLAPAACAGRDAVIEASFYGTSGGAALRNQNGSFFDFQAELYRGQTREILTSPPDDWGGRAASDWVTKLAAGERFGASTTGLFETATLLDRLYGG